MPSIIRVRWLLKSCPKCGGDLYYDMERDGEYMQCLQCGYESDTPGKIQEAVQSANPGVSQITVTVGRVPLEASITHRAVPPEAT